MRVYWSQAVMLLLGITLTVGFYEGRRLVKNTAKALTAATSMTASAGKRNRDRAGEDEDGFGVAAAEEGDRPERKRRRSRPTGEANTTVDPVRADRVTALRTRQKERVTGRMVTAPIGTVHLPGSASAIPGRTIGKPNLVRPALPEAGPEEGDLPEDTGLPKD